MEASIVKRFAQLTDLEVVGKVLQEEVELYEIIIRRYNPYLYKIARSYGYSHDDSQDLMQDTFVNAYLNLDKFENRSTFKTWIVRIMLNNCYQKKERLSFKKIVNDEIKDDVMKPLFSNGNENNPAKSLANRELGVVLEKAITELPLDFRMVFSLREMSGMSTTETAETLKLSESNVKVRLNRAKKMLRLEIEKMYSPDEIFDFNLVFCTPMVDKVMKEIAAIAKN